MGLMVCTARGFKLSNDGESHGKWNTKWKVLSGLTVRVWGLGSMFIVCVVRQVKDLKKGGVSRRSGFSRMGH